MCGLKGYQEVPYHSRCDYHFYHSKETKAQPDDHTVLENKFGILVFEHHFKVGLNENNLK